MEIFAVIVISFALIRHPGNEKETGAEMRPAIGSGIVTGTRQSAIGQFLFPVLGNSPRGLCEC